jgi:uncharacterized protein
VSFHDRNHRGDAALPSLSELHRRSVADWRKIFADHPLEGVAWIRFAAEHGFRAAQLVLGQMHLEGSGVARDPRVAYGWFTKAAAIGSLEARNMVGRCHELGWGVPVDQAEALRHYRQAAAGGLAWGLYNLGCLRLYGTGVRRDHAEAFACFAAAASQGHAKSIGLLGRCHEEGWGIAVNRQEAARLYEKAAQGGDCWGALNLGLIRAEEGRVAAAAPLFRRAVETATPNCHRTIAATLRAHAEPAYRAVGDLAAAALRSAPDGPPAERPPLTRPRTTDEPKPRRIPWLAFAVLVGAGRARLRRRRGSDPARPGRAHPTNA